MEKYIKKFIELNINDLYEIYKLRQEIFIVEQNCPYQDIDNVDKNSYHIYYKDNDNNRWANRKKKEKFTLSN